MLWGVIMKEERRHAGIPLLAIEYGPVWKQAGVSMQAVGRVRGGERRRGSRVS